MTVQHVDISDAQRHEPKGASTAVSGTVYVSDGAGSGAWEQQIGQPSKVVNVELVEDFPTAVGGVITLAGDTLYQINNQVDIGSDRIVFGVNSLLRGVQREIAGITSTTTSALLTSTGVNMRLERLNLVASSSTELLTFDGSGTKILSIRDCTGTPSSSGCIARVTSHLAAVFFFCNFIGGGDGIFFSGANNGTLVFDTCGLFGFTGTGMDFGTSITLDATLRNSTIQGTGGADICLKGAAGSANILTGTGRGKVTHMVLSGTTVLSGIAQDDTGWTFIGTQGVADSREDGQVFLDTSSLTTAIGVQDTPVLVNGGTDWVVALEDRFTGTTSGRLTYIGLDPIQVRATATINGTAVSGTSTYTFYIAKNGAVDNSSRAPQEFTSTADGALSVIGLETLVKDDFIELFVENNSGTTDFNLKDANIVVNS